MRDIKETLTYKRLRMYLIIYIVALFIFVPVLVLLRIGGDSEKYRFVLKATFLICGVMFLPFIAVNAYRMYRFVKVYKNNGERLKTDKFSFLERPIGWRSRACSILVTIDGKTYHSPCIFSVNEISAMLDQTLVYLFDGETMYPLWGEPKNGQDGNERDGKEDT